jgi:hypothetical protein
VIRTLLFALRFVSHFSCLISEPLVHTIMAPSARGWQMIEIVTVLVALCFISVVLRVVARLQRRVGFGVDDYLSVLSMVLMIAMLIELGLCELLNGVWFLSTLTDIQQGVRSEAMGPTSKISMQILS